MRISKFPDCCTSLILSNIPYRLQDKIDPLVFGIDRTLYYLLDNIRAHRHYCNIHAILTDSQIQSNSDKVLLELGFQKVNSSKKYPDGGEQDTGNLNTFVARWQDFRMKVREKLDLDSSCNRIRVPYNKSEDEYTYTRMARKLPVYGPLFKLHVFEGNSRKAFNTIAETLGFGQVEECCTRYSLFICSDLFRTDTLPVFWNKPAKGADFYKFLSGLSDARDYQTASNLLIERYGMDLPKYKI